MNHYGGPIELKVLREDCPEPKDDEARVRVLAAGVSLPDVMMREGIHPETPALPFTPGWDLVGVVDRIRARITGIRPGQIVSALPIHGAYAQFLCLRERELIPAPAGLNADEAVCLVLNYITAYQMMHRSAKAKPGQSVLIHGAAGGVGSALVQLGRVAGLRMYGTCSARAASAVAELGCIPIDYEHQDSPSTSPFRSPVKTNPPAVGVTAATIGVGDLYFQRTRTVSASTAVIQATHISFGSVRPKACSGSPDPDHAAPGLPTAELATATFTDAH